MWTVKKSKFILENVNICDDLHDVVLGFMFKKCVNCNKFKEQENLNIRWDNSYVCDECLLHGTSLDGDERYYKCFHCSCYYKKNETSRCFRCSGRCIINCIICHAKNMI